MCPTLSDLMDCSPPGSSAHRILQARILEWVAICFYRGSSQPRDRTWVSHIAGRIFTVWATKEAQNIYITIGKIDTYGNLLYDSGNSTQVLCDNLEEWDMVGGGKQVQEERDIFIAMADLCWCMAETNTVL